jgi:hypothetical protein
VQPHVERAVVGWVVAYPPLRAHRHVAAASPYSATCYTNLVNHVQGQCTGQLVLPNDKSTARQWLPKLVDGVEALVGGFLPQLGQQEQAAYQTLLGDLDAAVKRFVGGSSDPLNERLEWARGVTEHVYRTLAPAITHRIAAIDRRIKADNVDFPPSSIRPWRVGASCSFPSAGPAEAVTLWFGKRLDWESWLVVPYLLLHEYVSHGAQGPWNVSCRGPTESDLFAEGWMDVVAVTVHDLAVLGFIDGFEELAESHEMELQAGRYAAVRREHGDPTAVAERGEAVIDAMRFHRFLQGRRSGLDQRFLNLSLALNVSGLTVEERHRFVLGIREALRRTAAREPFPAGGTLGDWIADYDRTRNATALAQRALDLYAHEASTWSTFS